MLAVVAMGWDLSETPNESMATLVWNELKWQLCPGGCLVIVVVVVVMVVVVVVRS